MGDGLAFNGPRSHKAAKFRGMSRIGRMRVLVSNEEATAAFEASRNASNNFDWSSESYKGPSILRSSSKPFLEAKATNQDKITYSALCLTRHVEASSDQRSRPENSVSRNVFLVRGTHWRSRKYGLPLPAGSKTILSFHELKILIECAATTIKAPQRHHTPSRIFWHGH